MRHRDASTVVARIGTWLVPIALAGCTTSVPQPKAMPLQEGIPLSIQAPPGHVPVMPAFYQGVLVYTCVAKNNLYDWSVTETQGTVDFGAWGYGRHEGPGFTWRLGDSLVQGDAVASWNGGERTDAPWELYQIHAATGTTPLAKATYIQRIQTNGGGYPVLPCSRTKRNLQDFIRVQGYFVVWTQSANS